MKASLNNSDKKVQYTLVRKKGKKHLTLRITNEGEVIASVPFSLPQEAVDTFVQSKQSWVESKLETITNLPPPLDLHTYEEGDRFMVLGKLVTLSIHPTTDFYPPRLEAEGLHLFMKKESSKRAIKTAVMNWYKEYALSLYLPLVKKWVERLNIKTPYSVTIVNYPKRMGSCSSKQVLSFAVRSLMLPPHLIDYLALHEVAHLRHFNHGDQFKALLGTYMSDWRERKNEISRLRLSTSRI